MDDGRFGSSNQTGMTGGVHADGADPVQDASNLAVDPSVPFSCDVDGHAIDFLPDGADRLDTLLRIIDEATYSLDVIFYIFTEDASGRRVRDALVRATERGVRVVLLIDSFGSSRSTNAFFRPIVDAGGIYRCFSPRWSQRYLIRNHQKLVIADRSIAMFGGFNVEDDYFAPQDDPNGWRDLGVMIRGPQVERMAMHTAGAVRWLDQPKGRWRDLRSLIRGWDPGPGKVQWLIGGPTNRLSPWARSVKRDIERGTDMLMAMAYFTPSQTMLRRIAALGKRGKAALILAAKSDNGATIGAARLLYGFLLKRGVLVNEFQPQKLHSKIIVIDDIVYVGSANFDMRSLFINLELMLRIDDAQCANRMRHYLQSMQRESESITPELHQRRANWLNRLRWTLSWFVVTVVDYTVTRRLNFGVDGGD